MIQMKFSEISASDRVIAEIVAREPEKTLTSRTKEAEVSACRVQGIHP